MTNRSAIVFACLLGLLAAPCASAQEMGFRSWGGRVGFRLGENDFDQIVIGGQADLGDVAYNLRFAPNVELGFGSDVTVFSFNPDLHYVFRDDPVGDATFFYAGGGLGLHILDSDASSESDIKISLVAGIEKAPESGLGLFGEFRASFVDGTWFEFLGGVNFLR
jgi:hypothetical protein